MAEFGGRPILRCCAAPETPSRWRPNEHGAARRATRKALPPGGWHSGTGLARSPLSHLPTGKPESARGKRSADRRIQMPLARPRVLRSTRSPLGAPLVAISVPGAAFPSAALAPRIVQRAPRRAAVVPPERGPGASRVPCVRGTARGRHTRPAARAQAIDGVGGQICGPRPHLRPQPKRMPGLPGIRHYDRLAPALPSIRSTSRRLMKRPSLSGVMGKVGENRNKVNSRREAAPVLPAKCQRTRAFFKLSIG